VASAAAAPPTAASGAVLPGQTFVDLPHSNIRKVTAKRMVENKNSNPHYYLTMEVCMDELIAMRAQVNELVDVKTSVNDFVIKACAKALVEVPVCNSSWSDEYIRQYSAADISVAVSTERGLLTPIIFGADTKSVTEISQDVKHLAGKAKDGSIKPDEFMGGTFTVSNLGMFGVSDFVSILPPGTGAILAVAASTPTFVQQKNGMLLGTLEPCP
jgi:pyruvate dehydrogenase E2 component (dihydrolipoamide acetyltransferase)